ncbi:unnamed protein product [Gongylonema pulchrum]|uniref:DUF1203 domain-containing protein n=1 Tax=Gongylonema pulchrum TaxID=637853 RepID=A0A183ELG7_9BILA|nr:unnamed protein product [Gongylonema pulchrum]
MDYCSYCVDNGDAGRHIVEAVVGPGPIIEVFLTTVRNFPQRFDGERVEEAEEEKFVVADPPLDRSRKHLTMDYCSYCVDNGDAGRHIVEAVVGPGPVIEVVRVEA